MCQWVSAELELSRMKVPEPTPRTGPVTLGLTLPPQIIFSIGISANNFNVYEPQTTLEILMFSLGQVRCSLSPRFFNCKMDLKTLTHIVVRKKVNFVNAIKYYKHIEIMLPELLI